MAGRDVKVELLNLITGDDFEWSYQWLPAWPSGRTLYYEFQDGTDSTWSTKWNFIITDDVAYLKIESTVADLMPDRTPFRLVTIDSTTSPATDHVLVIGNVKRLEPKA